MRGQLHVLYINSSGPFAIHCYRQEELPDAIVGHNGGRRWLD